MNNNKKRNKTNIWMFWKQIFKSKFVNFVDLIDTKSIDKCVIEFDTLKKFKDYIIHTRKFFFKKFTYARKMLKFLLREIFNKHMNERSKLKRHWWNTKKFNNKNYYN